MIDNADLVRVLKARVLTRAVLTTTTTERNFDQPRLLFDIANRQPLVFVIDVRRHGMCLDTLFVIRCFGSDASLSHVDALISLNEDLVAEWSKDVAGLDDHLPWFC